jgi:HAD superfamily hydrolase (TIGR01490 family)
MENISSEGRCCYTVFIDLDNTLARKVSGKILALNAAKIGLLKLPAILRISYHYLLYKIGLSGPVEMSEKLTEWTKGLSCSDFDRLCIETTDNQLLKNIDNEIVTETGKHELNEAVIVILSASVTQVCSRIASYFGFEDVICTVLEIKDDKLTGKTEGKLCFGEEKLKRLRDFCREKSIEISESWYYGDSLSDLPVFQEVGHPVCVNPGKKLARIAAKNNWKILKTNS